MAATNHTGVVIHDSRIILDADAEACEMFRCDRAALIGLEIIDLLFYEDFQRLGELRMKVLREQGRIGPVEYPFNRFDGALFWAQVTTEKIAEGMYRSCITYPFY